MRGRYISLLRKLATGKEIREDAAQKMIVYTTVHENFSIVSPKQRASDVAFLRMSIGWSRLMCLSISSALMVACCCKPPNILPIEERYHLPARVNGASDKVMMRLIKEFNKNNVVKIITIGQAYLISIPSSALFADQSPRIKWESYALLNQIVKFMKQFRKIAVTVTSYSSQYVSVRREQALTLARARGVADYLWNQGVDSRFIFIEGAGSEKPISSFTGGGDRTPNSRIEITFHDALIN